MDYRFTFPHILRRVIEIGLWAFLPKPFFGEPVWNWARGFEFSIRNILRPEAITESKDKGL
jgi:hypothetical protein